MLLLKKSKIQEEEEKMNQDNPGGKIPRYPAKDIWGKGKKVAAGIVLILAAVVLVFNSSYQIKEQE